MEAMGGETEAVAMAVVAVAGRVGAPVGLVALEAMVVGWTEVGRQVAPAGKAATRVVAAQRETVEVLRAAVGAATAEVAMVEGWVAAAAEGTEVATVAVMVVVLAALAALAVEKAAATAVATAVAATAEATAAEAKEVVEKVVVEKVEKVEMGVVRVVAGGEEAVVEARAAAGRVVVEEEVTEAEAMGGETEAVTMAVVAVAGRVGAPVGLVALEAMVVGWTEVGRQVAPAGKAATRVVAAQRETVEVLRAAVGAATAEVAMVEGWVAAAAEGTEVATVAVMVVVLAALAALAVEKAAATAVATAVVGLVALMEVVAVAAALPLLRSEPPPSPS